MADEAHVMTENMLSKLENDLRNEYQKAYDDMMKKLEKKLTQYETALDKQQAKFDAGQISKKEFDTWKQNQVAIINNKQNLAAVLAEDLTHTDEIAAAIINGHTPNVYALNYNFGTYQIESDIKASTSFVLYDRATVENLIANNPDLLPHPTINIPKDMKWNKAHITSAITQGVLQGESIPKIANRLSDSVGMSHRAAIRNARTATTGAQNVGRINSYHRAKNLGIDVQKKWLSGADNRVRHSHRQLDGVQIDINDMFPNGCEFPGDPKGPGWEVYNCRCTLVPVIKGFERSDQWKYDKQDYEEWKKGGTGFAHWLGEQAMPDSAIISEWSGKKMSNIYTMIKAQNTKDANAFYKELGKLGKPSEVWDKYLTGQLDANELANFEGILKKYLPQQTTKVDDLLAYKQGLPDSLKELAFDHPDLINDIKTEIMQAKGSMLPKQYWNLYQEGKIENSTLDDILKAYKNKSAVNKVDNAADVTTGAFDINKYKAQMPNKTWKIPDVIGDDDYNFEFYEDITEIIDKNKNGELLQKYWQKYLADEINDPDLDHLFQVHFAPETLPKNQIAKEAQDSLDKLKFAKGTEMNFADADTHKPNPFYDPKYAPSKINCQTTTFAYECRRQGYDVVAIPKYGKKMHGDFDDILKMQEKLGADQANGWINKVTGKPPKRLIDHIDYDAPKQSVSEMLDELENAVGKNGERYTLGIKWNSGGCHAINLDRDENGLLRIIDNQRGVGEKHVWVGNEVEDYLSKKSVYKIRNVYRVDDCAPNADYFNSILLDAKKIKTGSNIKEYSDLSDDFKKKVQKIAHGKPDTGQVYYTKWKCGMIDDSDLDNLFKTAPKTTAKVNIPTPKPAAATATKASAVDIDALKDKKVTAVYKEIKADMSSKDANAFYNELKKIGQKDGLKQGDVWKKYLAGELDADDVAKIDKHLVSKYGKTAAKPEVDYMALGSKKMSQVYTELKAENTSAANKFYNELKKHGKPSKVWEKYVNGELSEDVMKKIDAHLIDKYSVGGAKKAVANVADKVDDAKLKVAEAKLKKAQDDLAKLPNPTYKGIWKDDVTLADYESKKSTIKAKKIYYDEELDKLLNDPNYKHWLSDVDKQQKIQDLYKLKADLDDFEKAGKEYAKAQKAVDKAKQEVVKHTPIGEAYTQARKDAARWAKNNSEYSKLDKIYDKETRPIQKTRTAREKSGYDHYTWGSGPFNQPLVGYKNNSWSPSNFVGPGKVDINANGYGDRIRGLTTYVEKSKQPEDFWIQSGQNTVTLDGMFGFSQGTVDKMSDSELKSLIGQERKLPQFISGSINRGGGSYVPGDTMFNIYCPKGSEALYVLEDGHFGKNEHEMILQRGGTYKITDIYYGTVSGKKRLVVDMELHLEKGYDKFQQ